MEYLVEIGILAALAWPALRGAVSPSFRRVFPFDAMRFGVAVLLYLSAIAALALWEPRWLRVPAVFAAAAGAYLLWRGRPGFGVASGLPPGSLSPLPIRPWSDSDFYARQAARYGDIFKMSQFGRPMVCIVGLERANRLLLEYDEQLVAPPLPFNRFIEGGYLRYLPEETHESYRRFFHSLFHSEVIANAEPRLADAFSHALTEMAETTAKAGSTTVKVPLLRMMFAAWTKLFFGIDERHRDFTRLGELFRVIDTRRSRWASRRKVEAALAQIEVILQSRVRAFSATEIANPSCFLAALARNDPHALADRTVLGNLIYIMQVTWGDVTGLLTWIFKMLSDNPVWQDRLASDRSRDLATRVVQETLRLEQSESRYRRALADLELDGFRIPKGWLVRMCIRESHQNDKTFPDPTVFNPDRFAGRTFTRGEYAPFGAFRLACIGANVATTVGAVFATELVSGFEWQVVEDGPAEISNWVHNAPSPRLRVKMAPRVS